MCRISYCDVWHNLFLTLTWLTPWMNLITRSVISRLPHSLARLAPDSVTAVFPSSWTSSSRAGYPPMWIPPFIYFCFLLRWRLAHLNVPLLFWRGFEPDVYVVARSGYPMSGSKKKRNFVRTVTCNCVKIESKKTENFR